ncbi:hypothetical protein JR334_01935 [Clostridia bacterium]|nr:hypothetical protein JR334_01935 [Clostridia bacterium]
MINVFRMKSLAIISKLMQSPSFALVNYRNEGDDGHSLEVITPNGRFEFVPSATSLKAMDEFMEEEHNE